MRKSNEISILASHFKRLVEVKYRFINNVEYVNTIEIGIDSSATRYVDLGNAQSAWLAALGLGSTAASTISNIFPVISL